MTWLSRRARLSLLIIGLSIFMLQGCSQDKQPQESTAIPNPPVIPTAVDSVVNDSSTPVNVSSTPVNASSTPVPSPTPLPVPFTAVPTPTSTTLTIPTPTVTAPLDTGQTIIGYSLQNQPIIAYWAGSGAKKVAFIGGQASIQPLVAHYQNNPISIPSDFTIWFVPNPNPDNPDSANLLNANGINLYHNADTRFVACPNQSSDLAPTNEAMAPYPFSEPESQAQREFLADAWMVVLLTAEAIPIHPGGCGTHQPSNALAALLAGGTQSSVENSTLADNHLVDYLAGQGTAAVILNQAEIDTAVIDSMLINADQINGSEAFAAAGNFEWFDETNSGTWQFPIGTFIHPLSIKIIGQEIYLLDSGQVQRINQASPTMPEIILAPDDEVAGVRVIEPIDLATDGETLIVLDRAGDVYSYDPKTAVWSLLRYDRPVGETSSHYYLALAAQSGQLGHHYLLEGSYHYALNQQTEQPDFIWPLPENHQIDIATNNNDVYILSQSPLSKTAGLIHYQQGARDNVFSPTVSLFRPRQIQAAGSLVYILDYSGRRLSAVEATTGALTAFYLPADGKPFSAFLVDEGNGRIILAGQDKLSFFGEPENTAVIQGTGPQSGSQLHDPHLLETLRGLLMPIGGSDIAVRENQMPGAPRHYRLGVHEGADFYWQAGTLVRAVAAGTVIRATVDYEIPSQQLFNSWQAAVQALGYTSPEAHDFYRGMQVWIQHEGGLISRYVHLSSIDTIIQEGATVQAGQIIGTVGNTGSPVSIEGPDTDAHLHFELWLNDQYLGQFLRPIETREWLMILLNEQ